MKLFRISKTKYIRDLFGTGAKENGGRWNRPGVAALYTSEAKSLAMLELLVHFASKSAFKNDYSFVSLEFSNLFIIDIDKKLLPKSEIEINDNRLWEITDYYFFKKNVPALRVPSILINDEFNVIINPIHKDFNQLLVYSFEKVTIDERFKNII